MGYGGISPLNWGEWGSRWSKGINTLLKEGDPIDYASMEPHKNCQMTHIKDGQYMCKEEYDERCRLEAEHDRNVQQAYREGKTATEVASNRGRSLQGISDMVRTNLLGTSTSGASGTCLTMKSMNRAIKDLSDLYNESAFKSFSTGCTPWKTEMKADYFSQTEDDKRNKDLLDLVTDISPEESPFIERLKDRFAEPTLHQWKTYDEAAMWPKYITRDGMYSLGVEENYSSVIRKEKDTKAHDLFWSAYSKTGKLPFEARYK